MKNHCVANAHKAILYNKALRVIAKSATSTLLMGQLEFFFSNPKYQEGFYKFLSPCSHPVYKEEDSWCEALAFSEEEFRTAFENIGVAYKSKSDFNKSPDKFQGRFYCSYYDRRAGLTWYFRNHELVDSALEAFQNPVIPVSRNRQPQLLETDDPSFQKPTTPVSRNRQPQFLETDDPGFPYIYRNTENTTEATRQREQHKQQQQDPPLYFPQRRDRVFDQDEDQFFDQYEDQDKNDLIENTDQPLISKSIQHAQISTLRHETPLSGIDTYPDYLEAPSSSNKAQPSNIEVTPSCDVAFTPHSEAPPNLPGTPPLAKKPRPTAAEKGQALYAPFLEIWNSIAPIGFMRHKVIPPRALNYLKKQWVPQHGDRSLEAWEGALRRCQADPFTRDRVDWTMSQFCSNDKPSEYWEKWQQYGSATGRQIAVLKQLIDQRAGADDGLDAIYQQMLREEEERKNKR